MLQTRETLLVACLFAASAVGFQAQAPKIRPSPSALMRTGTRSTSLFYSNKTEILLESESSTMTAGKGDSMIYSSWGSYRDTGESVEITEKPVLELDELDDYMNQDDQWAGEYYEDGTPYVPTLPTLELLKSWTQEYVDAVDLAGGMTRVSVGIQNMLSSDFVFTSPTLGPLNKADYVKLMDYYRHCGLDLASAIPDLKVTYEGWHVDPHEPWRCWAVARYSGTHLGTVVLPGTDLKLTPPNKGDHPAKFVSGPEMQSFLWTPDKELLWHTMGYVGDEYTGSNQGYGGLDGLMVSMGLPHLYLDAMSPMRKLKSWFSQFQSDFGEDNVARDKTRYGRLPQWWNERKSYDLNIHK